MSTDQSTQVNFPVLLRSQQKALKRYATLAEFKPFPARQTSNHWPILSRPKSLNLDAPSRSRDSPFPSIHTLNHIKQDIEASKRISNGIIPKQGLDRQKNGISIRNKLSPLPIRNGDLTKSVNILESAPVKTRLTTVTSCNTLSPKQLAVEPPSSYTGSDVSIYDRYSPGTSIIFSGQYHHQNKWRIGVNPAESTISDNRMCTCQHEHRHTSDLRNTNTPEGLSWRRLHMSRAKLKATATTSELLSGFAMVAMVELQINEETSVPEWLFVLFAVCTTILVAVHIFALMISTYILPNIDAISKLDVCELVTESPHERMKGFIELAWAFSTILGLFLFLVEIAILCWVKFWDYSFTAAIAATVIVIPVLVIFVAFAVHFYHSLVVHKCNTSVSDIEKLEDMKKELDQVINPV